MTKQIIIVKPKSLSPKDKEKLTKAGNVVVELAEPGSMVIKPHTETMEMGFVNCCACGERIYMLTERISALRMGRKTFYCSHGQPQAAIKKMKTGIELIAEERREQIEKHGFSIIDDADYYKEQELIQAVLFCIGLVTEPGSGLTNHVTWPEGWDQEFAEKIKRKDSVGRLKVAGAFCAAEIDRLQAKEGKQ